MTLEACLEALSDAIAAARELRLPTDAAEAARNEVVARLGFPADVYVLALIGGTGVGKSSLLNALAGGEVSRASARRPTTDRPVAWIPESARADVGPLLDRLEVREIRAHADDTLGRVAILDLPDMDSLAADHRAQVEAVLPRVDAVAWVTDPEKYHDAVLHDEFLRRWLPRLDRQVLVVNKRDRLTQSDAERLRVDLAADVAGTRATVALTSAQDGAAGLTELRSWLDSGIEAKQIVRARLAASVGAATRDLGLAAGLDPSAPAQPLVTDDGRRRTLDRVTAELLRAIDLPGLERQAAAATSARARSRGGGPVGLAISFVTRAAGRDARVADPAGFLARWRERSSLVRAVDALRTGLAEVVAAAPAPLRATLAAAADAGEVERGLVGAVDAAIPHAPTTVPSSRLWPLIGVLQTISTGALIFAVAWIALAAFASIPVATVTIQPIGEVPMPLLMLAGALAASWILGRLVGFHARWLARRWARRLGGAIRTAVESAVAGQAFAGVDRIDAARQALATAAAAAQAACAVP